MLSLALLGDSIAYGQGAERPEDTVGRRLAAALEARGRPTRLAVYAVPGDLETFGRPPKRPLIIDDAAGQLRTATRSKTGISV